VPFHAWVPEIFDQGRLGPAILFSAPPAASTPSPGPPGDLLDLSNPDTEETRAE
jgi:hypothetical protein